MNDLTQKKIVVVGLGESGVAAAELAILRGAVVVGSDSNSIDNLSPEAQALVQKGVRLSSGPADAALFQGPIWSWCRPASPLCLSSSKCARVG